VPDGWIGLDIGRGRPEEFGDASPSTHRAMERPMGVFEEQKGQAQRKRDRVDEEVEERYKEVKVVAQRPTADAGAG